MLLCIYFDHEDGGEYSSCLEKNEVDFFVPHRSEKKIVAGQCVCVCVFGNRKIQNPHQLSPGIISEEQAGGWGGSPYFTNHNIVIKSKT